MALSYKSTNAEDLHRSADALLRSIYEKRVAWSALPTAYEQKMRGAYACMKEDSGAAAAWQRLLNHLGLRTGLLSVEPAIPALGPQPGNTGLDALLHLALRYEDWLRGPEEWAPEGGGGEWASGRAGGTGLRSHDSRLSTRDSTRFQIGGLARHLLTCYEVPAFMDAAWFEGFTEQGRLHRDWFVHIGTGGNVRTAGGPVRLTKMAAHHFVQAPEGFSITQALRWGQTLGLGGDEYMGRAIAESRLAAVQPDEPFWESVIHFFVNNPQMDRGRIGPIVDFLHYQKFGEQPDNSDAPEPNMTMKGRTLAALQKRVEEWHEALARDARKPPRSWEPTGIESFRAEERDIYGTLNEWVVVELLNSRALQEEGREMRHCVFTYAAACMRGTTSIWSLRVRSAGEGKMRRLLTIEVDNARRAIVQVRGRCNKSLGALKNRGRMRIAGEMLRRWAQESRLSIHCSI